MRESAAQCPLGMYESCVTNPDVLIVQADSTWLLLAS